MADGDTGLTNLVLTGNLTVGDTLTVKNDGLTTISQTFALADFADVTTTGTAEFDVDIPAGAYVLCSKILDVTGFIGNTSATLQIGDGTDADRYSTGTPSVFTTATYVDAGKPSGAPFHAAAKTPTLIVTAASDFTSVTAGAVTVEITFIA